MVTVAFEAATERTNSTACDSFDGVTFTVCVSSAKPSAVARTWYSPGTSSRENSPFSLVTAEAGGTPLPLTQMSAFGTAARLGSSTFPASRVAFWVVWAPAQSDRLIINRSAAENCGKTLVIILRPFAKLKSDFNFSGGGRLREEKTRVKRFSGLRRAGEW